MARTTTWTLATVEGHPRFLALPLRRRALLSYRYAGGSVESAAVLFRLERAEVRRLEAEALATLTRETTSRLHSRLHVRDIPIESPDDLTRRADAWPT